MRNIGEMKERISLYSKAIDTRSGTSRKTLVKICDTFSAVYKQSASEYMRSEIVSEEVKAVFCIRKPLGIKLNSGVVIRWGKREFEVVEVAQNARWKGFLDLRAFSVEMEKQGYEYA